MWLECVTETHSRARDILVKTEKELRQSAARKYNGPVGADVITHQTRRADVTLDSIVQVVGDNRTSRYSKICSWMAWVVMFVM
ncbi:hypothetical protein AVEN_130450-1 [Araneus ventricosus]|uniref:Uncharacterized protein n=1 Tax=Araneus ventricosus TaxID=182803 RepID=A0A4Y2MM30_ARAVE|nr:hypothetical protein AVEN_130450-1 [Araneus ventricosus]